VTEDRGPPSAFGTGPPKSLIWHCQDRFICASLFRQKQAVMKQTKIHNRREQRTYM